MISDFIRTAHKGLYSPQKRELACSFERIIAMNIGDKLRLSGGYDMNPRWLQARNEYYATVVAFLENNKKSSSTEKLSALIEFDEFVTFEGMTGKFGLLDLRYVGQAWENSGSVHVFLLKEKINSIQARNEETSRWMESHATYEVVEAN
jgi:hypothetical protein